MPRHSRLAVAALCLAALAAAPASAADLKVGDPAPAITVAKFVKGEPVEKFDQGKIYVVEFWATWCPPCRESIPHLTAMQKANPDVTFIGSDVGEDEATVAPFVKEMGDKMDYRVAVDKDGAMNAAYMTAAGQNGIPTAFVVGKDGKVAWIGHPMELEPVLKQVVAGTFDAKKAGATKSAAAEVMKLAQAQDWDGAIKKADEAIAADPTQAGPLGVLEFQILAKGKNDPVAAGKKADEIADKVDDADPLNMMAWLLVTADKTTPETVATAKKLSESSLAKSPDNWQYLDTLARVYAVKKEFPKAVELETKAIDKCDADAAKGDLKKALAAYNNGTLPAAE